MAGGAGWKGREKADPLTACMAKNEKKFCYMYLPHYENVDDQFVEWIRKDCRHVLEDSTVPLQNPAKYGRAPRFANLVKYRTAKM